MKVFVEHQTPDVISMFRDEGYEPVSLLYDADLVCRTGGHDVSLGLYLEPNTAYNNS